MFFALFWSTIFSPDVTNMITASLLLVVGNILLPPLLPLETIFIAKGDLVGIVCCNRAPKGILLFIDCNCWMNIVVAAAASCRLLPNQQSGVTCWFLIKLLCMLLRIVVKNYRLSKDACFFLTFFHFLSSNIPFHCSLFHNSMLLVAFEIAGTNIPANSTIAYSILDLGFKRETAGTASIILVQSTVQCHTHACKFHWFWLWQLGFYCIWIFLLCLIVSPHFVFVLQPISPVLSLNLFWIVHLHHISMLASWAWKLCPLVFAKLHQFLNQRVLLLPNLLARL